MSCPIACCQRFPPRRFPTQLEILLLKTVPSCTMQPHHHFAHFACLSSRCNFFPLPSFFPSLFLNSVLRLLVPDTHSVIVSYSCHSFREFSPWCQYGPALIESDHLLPGGCFDKPQSHLIISLIFNVIKPNNTFCVWRYVFITTQMTGRKKKHC